ncbi:energy transducer TonB [Flavobacterium franklandianum]|uniref:Energy transducer TonB n=1 Tax=Flavobacterium franklandianum TaxID=2594430 RepID=A0A553CQP6_9FLAO|nr:energy transducer TonB [Flavobacterium franklandianum]TRX22868.1 energy transducer TonB [Flavobacterium franklandianum]
MSSTISSDQKKSLAISVLLYGTLLMILFFIRFWPPSNLEELIGAGGGGGGVTVNFGDSDFGSGANYKSEVLNVKNQAKQTPAKSTPDESILSQENSTEESVVIPQKEKPLKPTPVLKEEPKPVVVKPRVSNNTNDALSSIMKGSNKGGDGDDKTAGNKGKANGSLSSNGYYGSGGSGGGTGGGNGTGNGIGTGSGYGAGSGGGSGNGSGYSLGNRKAISKPAPKYTCNESGKVVVEVSVDRNGRTIDAIAGIKGTTNTAKCLLDQARIAAMNTRWDASSDAPEKQVGKIVYNFNLN